VEAALQLHTTKGPARTSMQDIALLADVSLVTVYRHFPELKDLFRDCGERFREKYPFPGPDILEGCQSFEKRVSILIGAIYQYYAVVGDAIWLVQCDAEALPHFDAVFQRFTAHLTSLAEAALLPLSPKGKNYRRVLATIKLAIGVGTWRNLVRLQGLSSDQASELMADMVLCAAGANRDE